MMNMIVTVTVPAPEPLRAMIIMMMGGGEWLDRDSPTASESRVVH
jgi:hypothetical protein